MATAQSNSHLGLGMQLQGTPVRSAENPKSRERKGRLSKQLPPRKGDLAYQLISRNSIDLQRGKGKIPNL